MEIHSADGKTCDLKVNTCCEECASKLKEKLQELNGVNSVGTIHGEKEMVQDTNEKDPHHGSIDEEKEVVTNTKRKNKHCLKNFRKRISRIGKLAGLLVMHKIKNFLSAPKKSKPPPNQVNQPPPIFNSVSYDYKKRIVSRARNCQYCSESDSSDCEEDKHSNIRRRTLNSSLYRHRPPLALVHQAKLRSSTYANNWGRTPLPLPAPAAPPPLPVPLPPQQPLLLPRPPLYAPQNPYGYNLIPPPHLYGYHNPYSNYNFIKGMDVPRSMYPYYYDQKPRDPPVGNSFIHFFSDENTDSSCSVM